MPARTLYVKELTSPSSYALSDSVSKIDVEVAAEGGSAAAVYTSDTPQNDPVNIMLQKVDAETGSTALGAATLSGAHFTVRYFDTTDAQSLAKDYTTRSSAAKKTWVYETQEDGRISLQVDKPISGDEVYKDANNDPTLPCGTYVIEETLAPTGYLLPDYENRTFIEVVAPQSNNVNESVDTYHT